MAKPYLTQDSQKRRKETSKKETGFGSIFEIRAVPMHCAGSSKSIAFSGQ